MNYKIIQDENELLKFIHFFLPELEKGETYYVALFARKKYFKALKSDKTQIKRFTSNKDRLFQKLRQLECEVGCYQQDGLAIPQEALSVYITPNPRSYRKATHEASKRFSDMLYNTDLSNLDPHKEVLNSLQVSCSRKKYFDFDFDHVDLDETLKELEGKINKSCLHAVKTVGGFHLLVELEKIDKQYKNWYNTITTLNGCDVRGDNLLPIPGTTQSTSSPKIIF